MVRVPDAERLGRMLAESKRQDSEIADLQRTDGSQYARTLEKIKALVAGLSAQVQSYILAFSYTKAQIDAIAAGHSLAVSRLSGIVPPGSGGTGTANVYSTTSTGSQLAVYVKPDGNLTVGASSERFKRFISDWGPDLVALMGLAPRSFEWRDYPGEIDIGLIAEEAYAAGLHWLVRFDGPVIEGIRYERLSVALLAVTQNLHAQIGAHAQLIYGLEARLSVLEEGTA